MVGWNESSFVERQAPKHYFQHYGILSNSMPCMLVNTFVILYIQVRFELSLAESAESVVLASFDLAISY